MKTISNGWRRAILLFLSLILLMSSMVMTAFAAKPNDDTITDDIGKYKPGNFSWCVFSQEWGARVTLVDAITGEPDPESLPIDYTTIDRVYAYAYVTSIKMGDVRHFGRLSKSDYRDNGYSLPSIQTTGYARLKPPEAKFEDGTTMKMPCCLNGTGTGVNQADIEKYFSNDHVIEEFAGNIGMDANEVKCGKYKFLVEPIVYLTRLNKSDNKWYAYAFTPTEMSMYVRNGKATDGSFGRANIRSWAKSLFLAKDDIGFKAFRECSDFGRFSNAGGAKINNTDYDTIENYLGMMTITFKENPVIHTYDIINNPKDPAPAEPPTDLTKGDITIVKLYMNAWKDKSGSYMGLEPAQPNAMFTQSNTTNSIVVSDETGDNKPGYNVVSWYVSTEAPKTDLKISDWVQFTKGEKALKDVFAIPGINGKNGTNGIYATQYYPVSGEKNGVTASSLATGNYDENAKK